MSEFNLLDDAISQLKHHNAKEHKFDNNNCALLSDLVTGSLNQCKVYDFVKFRDRSLMIKIFSFIEILSRQKEFRCDSLMKFSISDFYFSWLLDFSIKVIKYLSTTDQDYSQYNYLFEVINCIFEHWRFDYPKLLICFFDDLVQLFEDLTTLKIELISSKDRCEDSFPSEDSSPNYNAKSSLPKGNFSSREQSVKKFSEKILPVFRSSTALLKIETESFIMKEENQIQSFLLLAIFVSSSMSNEHQTILSISNSKVRLLDLVCTNLEDAINRLYLEEKEMLPLIEKCLHSFSLILNDEMMIIPNFFWQHVPYMMLTVVTYLLTNSHCIQGVRLHDTNEDYVSHKLIDDLHQNAIKVLDVLQKNFSEQASKNSAYMAYLTIGISSVCRWWKKTLKSKNQDRNFNLKIKLAKSVVILVEKLYSDGGLYALDYARNLSKLSNVTVIQNESTRSVQVILSKYPDLLSTTLSNSLKNEQSVLLMNVKCCDGMDSASNSINNGISNGEYQNSESFEDIDFLGNGHIQHSIENLMNDIISFGMNARQNLTINMDFESFSNKFSQIIFTARCIFPFVLNEMADVVGIEAFVSNIISSLEWGAKIILNKSYHWNFDFLIDALSNSCVNTLGFGMGCNLVSQEKIFTVASSLLEMMLEKEESSLSIVDATDRTDDEFDDLSSYAKTAEEKQNLLSCSLIQYLHPCFKCFLIVSLCTLNRSHSAVQYNDCLNLYTLALKMKRGSNISGSCIRVLYLFALNVGMVRFMQSAWLQLNPLLILLAQKQHLTKHIARMIKNLISSSNKSNDPLVLNPFSSLISAVLFDRSSGGEIALAKLSVYMAGTLNFKQLMSGGKCIRNLFLKFFSTFNNGDADISREVPSLAGLFMKNSDAVCAFNHTQDINLSFERVFNILRNEISDSMIKKSVKSADDLKKCHTFLQSIYHIGFEASLTNSYGPKVLTFSLLLLIELWADGDDLITSESFYFLRSICLYHKDSLKFHLHIPIDGDRSRVISEMKSSIPSDTSKTSHSTLVMFDDYPVLRVILPSILEILMIKNKTKIFFEQIFSVRDLSEYLKFVMPFILPYYMMTSKRKALESLARLTFNLTQGPVAKLLEGQNCAHVLCQMLLSSKDNETDVDFSFLMSFFPENKLNDLVDASLPSLLGMLVWELAGTKHAKAAEAITYLASTANIDKLKAQISQEIFHNDDDANKKKRIKQQIQRKRFHKFDPFSTDLQSFQKESNQINFFEPIMYDEECEQFSTIELYSKMKEEIMITAHFLYLSSRVCYRKGMFGNDGRKMRSMHVFGRLLPYLLIESIPKFIPKILATINSALDDNYASEDLKLISYMVLYNFVNCMPSTTLSQCISPIIGTLIPATDGETPSIRQIRVKMIDRIIIGTQSKLEQSFADIQQLIVSVPGLENVYSIICSRVGTVSLTQQFKYLAAWMRDNNERVQYVAMEKLLSLLEANRKWIVSLFQNEVESVESKQVMADVIVGLLKISTQNSEARMKELCAMCLGEIGAIDTSLFSSPLYLSNSNTDDVRDVPKAFWSYDTSEFAMEILSNHLAPLFRAAFIGIDKIAFGIQELIKVFYMTNFSITDENQINETIFSKGLNSSQKKPMPEKIRAIMAGYKIMDVVEPFWDSRYAINDINFTWSKPFFTENITKSFDHWIGKWCWYLCVQSTGPLRPVFQACRSVVKAQSSIAQFLLPFLVADAIYMGNDEIESQILSEISSVLVNGYISNALDEKHCNDDIPGNQVIMKQCSKNFDCDLIIDDQPAISAIAQVNGHMAIQAIFTMIDILRNWRSPMKKYSLVKNVWGEIENSEAIMEKFLKKISLPSLISSSRTIGAHKRALLYMEQFIRSTPISTNCISTDQCHAPLNAARIDALCVIYHQVFEEPDGMSGLEALRRINGVQGSLRQQILFLEHNEKWSEALQIYEQAIHERKAAGSISTYSDVEKLRYGEWEKSEIECGVLNCLIQMGQLETAVKQANGIMDNMEGERALSLLPFAVEASWKLQSWENLSSLMEKNEEWNSKKNIIPLFQEKRSIIQYHSGDCEIALGKVMLMLADQKRNEFEAALAAARVDTISKVGVASMESYRHAYPLILQLHRLREVEQGFTLLTTPLQEREKIISDWRWDERISLVSPRLQNRESIMSVRRVIFNMANRSDQVWKGWLQLAKAARIAGRWNIASAALGKARFYRINSDVILIQQVKLHRSQGNVYEALQTIEPVEVDVLQLIHNVKNCNEDKKYEIAKKLLLSTNLMVEAGQKHGQDVIERYKTVLELHPKWEKGHFYLGQYLDFLYRARAKKDLRKKSVALHLKKGKGYKRKYENEHLFMTSQSLEEWDSIKEEYLLQTMENYAACLKYGNKYVFQALPRLLTLWFEIENYEINESKENYPASAKMYAALISNATAIIIKAVSEIPAYMWYTCLPQLMSRLGHPNDQMVEVVIRVLVNILEKYPQQALWHISGLSHSINKERKNIGERIIERAKKVLQDQNRNNDYDCLFHAKELFSHLIALAEESPSSERISTGSMKIGRRMNLEQFLVPLRNTLTVQFPKFNNALDLRSVEPFSTSQLHIKCFESKFIYMNSKERPKKISLKVLETGETIFFLCKKEKHGDLRKDARVMEVAGVVNRMLQKNLKGRSRNLNLRTFAVLCLNENCGMIEWVPNASGIRQLVIKTKEICDNQCSSYNESKIQSIMKNIQNSRTSAIDASLQFANLLSHCKPCLHEWFTLNFSDSSRWFEARTSFSRSAAVWSGVGFVLGLGDRHGENIMIDTNSGECVHIDFDCLFDKGVTLKRPEVVPFRLTSNMVDAMGVSGYEGIFRNCLEITMQVLRENRETLLSLLDPFLQDPTMGWNRSGRAQRDDESMTIQRIRGEATIEDAAEKLKVIDERLQGVYNIRVTDPVTIARLSENQKALLVSENIELPLSVQGQVQRLIHEATSHKNLCQMYIGWAPWM